MTDWNFSLIYSSSLLITFLFLLFFAFIEVIVNIDVTTTVNKMITFCIYLVCVVFIKYKRLYIKDNLNEKDEICIKKSSFLTSCLKYTISNYNTKTLNYKLQLVRKNVILNNILFRTDYNKKLDETFHVSSIKDLNLINDLLSCLVFYDFNNYNDIQYKQKSIRVLNDYNSPFLPYNIYNLYYKVLNIINTIDQRRIKNIQSYCLDIGVYLININKFFPLSLFKKKQPLFENEKTFFNVKLKFYLKNRERKFYSKVKDDLHGYSMLDDYNISICLCEITETIYKLKASDQNDMKNIFNKVSHEIKSSCISINNLILQVNQKVDSHYSNETNSLQDCLDKISVFSDYMGNTIHQVHDIIDDFHSSIVLYSHVNLKQEMIWIKDLAKTLLYTNNKHNVRLQLFIHDKEKMNIIFTDKDKLRIILTELIKNSINNTLTGEITITLGRKTNSSPYISIKDTGKGLSNHKIKEYQRNYNNHQTISSSNSKFSFMNFAKTGPLKAGLITINSYLNVLNHELEIYSTKQGTECIVILNQNESHIKTEDKFVDKAFKSKFKSNKTIKDSYLIQLKKIQEENLIIRRNLSLNFINKRNPNRNNKEMIESRKSSKILFFNSFSTNCQSNKNNFNRISNVSSIEEINEMSKKYEKKEEIVTFIDEVIFEDSDLSSETGNPNCHHKGNRKSNQVLFTFQNEENNRNDKRRLPFMDNVNNNIIDQNQQNFGQDLSNDDKSELTVFVKYIDFNIIKSDSLEYTLKNEDTIDKNKENNQYNVNNKEIYINNNFNSNNIFKSMSQSKSPLKSSFKNKRYKHIKPVIISIDDNYYCRQSIKYLFNSIVNEYNLDFELISLNDGLDLVYFIIKSIKEGIDVQLIISDENMVFCNGSSSLFIINTIYSLLNNSCKPPSSVILTALEGGDLFVDLKKKTNAMEVFRKPMSKVTLKEVILKSGKAILK